MWRLGFSWVMTLFVGAMVTGCAGGITEGKLSAEPRTSQGTSDDMQSATLERHSFSTTGWKTDFAKHAVPLGEITSGGPSKDVIPPIDKPKFLRAGSPIDWLKDNEPVVALVVGGEARAYPLQILIWHEIVNDTIGGTLVMVSFCPLCNTAIAFDRRLDGVTYDFGTTGNLRYSDLVMYDRQTESWWQQITGEAIVGALTGKRLTMLSASIVSWKDFRSTYPNGHALSKDTGFARNYGSNPYLGYDDVKSSPFLFSGPINKRLPPMERVVAVSSDGQDVAFPFSVLQQRKVLHHRVGGADLVVFWAPGTASALDANVIADSQDVGATGVFRAMANGRELTFEPAGSGLFKDRETGTTWNILGSAVGGPLVGGNLEPVIHANHFWFAWAVFKPNTSVVSG